MNRIVHLVIKYLYALVLLGSGAKHLYNIYWGDASIMATGYPEPEAQAFVKMANNAATTNDHLRIPYSDMGNSNYRSTMNFATRVWSEKCTNMR